MLPARALRALTPSEPASLPPSLPPAQGKLPWQGLKAKTKQDKYDQIGVMKNQMTVKELCENQPGAC